MLLEIIRTKAVYKDLVEVCKVGISTHSTIRYLDVRLVDLQTSEHLRTSSLRWFPG